MAIRFLPLLALLLLPILFAPFDLFFRDAHDLRNRLSMRLKGVEPGTSMGGVAGFIRV